MRFTKPMSKRKSANQAASLPVPSSVAGRHAAKESAVTHEARRKVSVRERLRRASSLIPVALAILTSINTLWLGYATDDSQQVLGNVLIRSLQNLPLHFTSGVWSFVNIEMMSEQLYYRPLFGVLFTFNYALFGTTLWAWHLANVIIHAAVTWLVYIVCKEITKRPQTALITAALFAVHPVHAESVAWISGITDPWLSLFFLTAFYCYLRYRKSGKTYLIVLTLILFLLALFAKESAVALPILIAYCELFHFNEGDFKQRLRRVGTLAAGFFAPVAIYFIFRRIALGLLLPGSDSSEPFLVAVKTFPLALVKYLMLITITMPYSYQHYTPFVTSITDRRFLVPFAIVVMLGCLVVFSKSRLLKFAAVWFLALLAPALLAIIYLGPEYLIQDRYLYLSSMGFCLVLAMGIEWLAARLVQGEKAAYLKWAIAGLLVVIFSAVLIRQNLFWKDDITLFQRCIAVDPTSSEAHTEMALLYFNAGRLREADAEAKRAIELNPQSGNAYQRLSFFSAKLGRLDDAINYLEQGIAALPVIPPNKAPLATMHLNLGLLYAQKKEFQLAEKHILQSQELRSRALGYYYTGFYYFNQKRYEEAISMYQLAAQKFPPSYAPIHLSMAATYDQLGQKENALMAYAKYLELAPITVPDREQVAEAMQRLQPRQTK